MNSLDAGARNSGLGVRESGLRARESPLASIHISNGLTYASLACGILTILAAMRGSAAGAGAFLAASALADTFDGRFARLFRRDAAREAIGVQLDSLSDAAAFGLAPIAAVSILLGARGDGIWIAWWIAAIVYAGCALTRLAFYNVSHAPNDTRGFVGIPTPIAALVWSSILAFGTSAVSASAAATLLGLAMVAPIPIRRPAGAGLTIFAMWPLTLLVVHWVNL
ncbi:MAG TPA: CDP-alcohol phosphatidyltransferase family protein [Vicinamibacterales bacterium]|jgi:phosphatidylserine synthase